jgi:hypothetical protein
VSQPTQSLIGAPVQSLLTPIAVQQSVTVDLSGVPDQSTMRIRDQPKDHCSHLTVPSIRKCPSSDSNRDAPTPEIGGFAVLPTRACRTPHCGIRVDHRRREPPPLPPLLPLSFVGSGLAVAPLPFKSRVIARCKSSPFLSSANLASLGLPACAVLRYGTTPAIGCVNRVPLVGLEPTHPLGHRDLNPARLPITPQGQRSPGGVGPRKVRPATTIAYAFTSGSRHSPFSLILPTCPSA